MQVLSLGSSLEGTCVMSAGNCKSRGQVLAHFSCSYSSLKHPHQHGVDLTCDIVGWTCTNGRCLRDTLPVMSPKLECRSVDILLPASVIQPPLQQQPEIQPSQTLVARFQQPCCGPCGD